MKYGYARVSTQDQNLALQLEALNKADCERIYQEKISGKNKYKPVLEYLLSNLSPGDQLMVWKLDRLGRKTAQLIELQESLEKKGVFLISITEKLDTSTPIGKFAFHILCGIAEMERNVISERTKAGLNAARLKGNIGGRRPGLSEKGKKQAEQAVYEYNEYLQRRDRTIKDICENVGISRATLYKYLRMEGMNIQSQFK